jgi:hypothetical protein
MPALHAGPDGSAPLIADQRKFLFRKSNRVWRRAVFGSNGQRLYLDNGIQLISGRLGMLFTTLHFFNRQPCCDRDHCCVQCCVSHFISPPMRQQPPRFQRKDRRRACAVWIPRAKPSLPQAGSAIRGNWPALSADRSRSCLGCSCHNQRGRAGSDGSSAMTNICARYIAAAFGSFPCIAPHGQCNRVMCP